MRVFVRSTCVSWLLVAAAFVLGGCPSTTGPGDGGEGGADVASDVPGDAPADAVQDVGSDVPGPTPCPPTLPTAGQMCGRDGLACQYGTDPRNQCRPTATCTAGQWMVQTPTCPPISPPAMCPATREMASGMACTTMDQVCAYADHACRCTNCRMFPVGGCGGPLMWQCDAPNVEPGCPAAIPRLGSSCSPEGQACSYSCEAHGIEGGRRCMGGLWVGSSNNCPISTRRVKRDITYLDAATRDRLAGELLRTRLATYEYTLPALAGARRLGFIIEDQPAGSFAVDRSGAMVDLYGYASMLVATVQRQDAELRALRAAVQRLEARAGGGVERSVVRSGRGR